MKNLCSTFTHAMPGALASYLLLNLQPHSIPTLPPHSLSNFPLNVRSLSSEAIGLSALSPRSLFAGSAWPGQPHHQQLTLHTSAAWTESCVHAVLLSTLLPSQSLLNPQLHSHLLSEASPMPRALPWLVHPWHTGRYTVLPLPRWQSWPIACLYVCILLLGALMLHLHFVFPMYIELIN